MSQFFKKSFYFDETRERAIDIEWNRGFKEVYISDNGKEIHKIERPSEVLKGISIKGEKGENLYLRLFKNPVRWEVMSGNLYLVNSFQSATDGIKGASTIFYIIFSLTILYISLMLAFLFEYIGSDVFSADVLLNEVFLVYYLVLALIFASAYLLRKGKLIWYYIGLGFYSLDTIGVFVLDTDWSGVQGFFMVLGLALRGTLIVILLRNLKHIRTMQKHLRAKKKNVDAEILDV